MTTTLTSEERFWSKVKKTKTCWLWTGALVASGHGSFRWPPGSILASRAAWILTYGEILPGLLVCHRKICPNKHCVRPAHMYLGTRSDNASDGHRVPRGMGKITLTPKPSLDPTVKRCKVCGDIKLKTAFTSHGMKRGKMTYRSTCKKCRNKRPQTIEDAFWRNVTAGDPSTCWIWQGYISGQGYGRLTFNGITYPAHQVSVLLTTGEMPQHGQLIRHRCPGGGTPACVNPAHLLVGTPADNSQDMIDSKRQLYGERNHAAKLTEAIVLQIYVLAHTHTIKALAVMFGVTISVIYHVLNGSTWKHVFPQGYVNPHASPAHRRDKAKSPR